MGRRAALLLVAAVVAALGSALVFIYVQGADARAKTAWDPVQVLTAVEVIQPGETIEQAQAAGKVQLSEVPREHVIDGALNSGESLEGKIALAAIFPKEQIAAAKFGDPGDQSSLTIPDGKLAISVNLSDPARVAGFVNPGSDVAIFMSGSPEPGQAGAASGDFTRILLPRIQVIAVGTTTVVSTTTTTQDGEQTTEQLPRTLLTLAVSQQEAEKIIYAGGHGELAFGLLTDESQVQKSPGANSNNVFN